MARRLIDISVPLQNDVPADPPGGHPTIQYIDHQQGLPRMLQFFEGLKAEDLPDGQGWAVEQVQLSTHNGTHLDAPWHFHPTMNRGERSCRWNGACSPASSLIFVICRMAMWPPPRMSKANSSA
jgi:Putative cyclase